MKHRQPAAAAADSNCKEENDGEGNAAKVWMDWAGAGIGAGGGVCSGCTGGAERGRDGGAEGRNVDAGVDAEHELHGHLRGAGEGLVRGGGAERGDCAAGPVGRTQGCGDRAGAFRFQLPGGDHICAQRGRPDRFGCGDHPAQHVWLCVAQGAGKGARDALGPGGHALRRVRVADRVSDAGPFDEV